MARYLLDTTVLIDFLRGRQVIVELLERLAKEGHELGVCAVNIAELYSGLSPEERRKADRLIDNLRYFDIDREAAKLAGSYRYAFARQGRPLSTADTLVAAAAVMNGAILITANVKDYPMEDLQLLEQPR